MVPSTDLNSVFVAAISFFLLTSQSIEIAGKSQRVVAKFDHRDYSDLWPMSYE